MSSVPILLVTANVGSIFEEPTEMLKLWTEEFLSKIASLDAKFIALHCQEVGGKKYEKSMKHVETFIRLLSSSTELQNFNKVRIFLDEDYTSVEHFTALGNLYFIHNSIENVSIWDFKKIEFIPVAGVQTFSGNIEAVDTKEKSKFPQHFFPESKWSRKGFMRTRWSLCGTVFDLVNIHLFHDASNLVSMSAYPSVYCRNRQRALEHTLYRFHNDQYDNVPYFVFGDFNFRTDNEGVIKKLTNGLTKTRVQNTKNNDQTKLHFNNEENNLILTVGKKEFSHNDHERVFLNYEWLKTFDKETESFSNLISEYPITFAPSYPYEEKVTKGTCYMPTRCPAWCDRVLFSHSAQKIIEEAHEHDYGLVGLKTCMGDHKADKEKKIKKKKKEEAPSEAPAAAAPAAETRTSSKSSSKRAKRSGSNVFSMFSQSQVAEFKEAFQLMDHDKDGIISKEDLRATFDAVGKIASEKELDEMIREAPGAINLTQLLGLFGSRMADSGGTDDDEVVAAAFRSFDESGTIDSEKFRHALMTWGDKFSAKEVDDAFDAIDIDDNGRIDTSGLITLLTAAAEEEGEGEAA